MIPAKVRHYSNSHPLGTVVIVSGLLGLVMGLSNATWQVTVESGQVLAGLVKYPVDNHFYIYHVKLFTIINQISALLLLLVDSEIVISAAISGLLGAVSFAAIATLIFAISRNTWIAVLGVLLVYFANYVGDGAVYPIWLLGHQHTNGILGLGFVILTIALLAARAYRSGLFCLALAPAVHPSLGVWLVIIVCVSAALHRPLVRSILSRHYKYLIAGALVTLAALACQLYLMKDVPTEISQHDKAIFDSYIKYWSSHHQKLYWGYGAGGRSFKRWGVIFCAMSVAVCWLIRRLLRGDDSVRFMCTILTVSGCGALLLGLVTQVPPERVPSYVLMFMPGRYLNLNNVVLVAIVLGFLTRRTNMPMVSNYNLFALVLGVSFFSRNSEVQFVLFAIVVLWLASLALAGQSSRLRFRLTATRVHKVGYPPLLAAALTVLLLVNLPRERFVNRYLVSPEQFRDRTNSEFYAKVSEGGGFLISTHYDAMISLKTRRPVLADMASPNTVTYAPQGAVAFNDILKKVYGIDLSSPPEPEYRHREIPPQLYRGLWEQRTAEQWMGLAKEFAATNVLAPADWDLKLPVAAQGENTTLYDIP